MGTYAALLLVAGLGSQGPVAAGPAPPAPPPPPAPSFPMPRVAPPPPRPVGEAYPIDPGSWIGEGDYPLQAIRNEEEGAVAVELEVTPDGRAIGCSVTASSGSESLDAATCRLVRHRGRFRPARDAEGRPIWGRARYRIAWALTGPPTGVKQAASGGEVTRLSLAGNGALISCATEDHGHWPRPTGFCDTVGSSPLAWRLAIRGGRGSAPVYLRLEAGWSVDGVVPFVAQHQLPGRRLVAFATSRFEVAEDGTVQNCAVTARRVPPEIDAELPLQLCDALKGFRFSPPLDARGNPARRTVNTLFALSREDDRQRPEPPPPIYSPVTSPPAPPAPPPSPRLLPRGTEVKLPFEPPLGSELRYVRTQEDNGSQGRKVNSFEIRIRFLREGDGYRMWTKVELPHASASLLSQAPIQVLLRPIEFLISPAGEITDVADEAGYWRGLESIIGSYASEVEPNAQDRKLFLELFAGMRRLPHAQRLAMISRNVAPILAFSGVEAEIGGSWSGGGEEVGLPIPDLPKVVREQRISLESATTESAFLQIVSSLDAESMERVIEALRAKYPARQERPPAPQSFPEISQTIKATVSRRTGLATHYVEATGGSGATEGESAGRTVTLRLIR